MRVPRISLGKLFNVLQSSIGGMATWPMRNIKTFPSKQMYLYLSLVERKEAEIYHNIGRMCYLVGLKWLIFFTFSRQLLVSLGNVYKWRHHFQRVLCQTRVYWEYTMYSQYTGGLKWKPWIPAENDDVIYEQPLTAATFKQNTWLEAKFSSAWPIK